MSRASLRTHAKVARATRDGYSRIGGWPLLFAATGAPRPVTEGQAISQLDAYALEAVGYEDWFQWRWRKRKTPLTDDQLHAEQIRHRRLKRQATSGNH